MASPPTLDTDETPWDETAEFVAATATVVRPGGLTAYVEPRPVGSSPADVTGFVPGQAAWTENNWPNILYILRPPPGWEDFRQSPPPPLKRDAQGDIIFERNPLPGKRAKPLRDFDILPDIIGTRNPWWYYEAIRRIDPRVCWSDILMRMPLEGRRRQNALNMESSRMRPRYNMISWHPTSNESKENEIRQRVMRKLTPQQIAANTTRGSTPGLINPLQGEAGGRVAHLVLRNGQGQVRGSRAQRPKKSKKINSSNRTVHSSEQAEEENLEAKLQEEDEVDQEPILELFPSVRRNYAANSITSSQSTRHAQNAFDHQNQIRSTYPRATSPRDTRSPHFNAVPGQLGMEEHGGLRKHRRTVHTPLLSDDEEVDSTDDHIRKRRYRIGSTRNNSRNSPIMVENAAADVRSRARNGVVHGGSDITRVNHFAASHPARARRVRLSRLDSSGSRSSWTQPNPGPRVVTSIPSHEEMIIARRQNHASYQNQQSRNPNIRTRPVNHPVNHGTSSRYGSASFSDRPVTNSSLGMNERQYLPVASNRFQPSSGYNHHVPSRAGYGSHTTAHTLQSWEYVDHHPTQRRAGNRTRIDNTEVGFPAHGYDDEIPAIRPRQGHAASQPIDTATSNFDFDVVQEQVSTRYTSPPLLSAAQSRDLRSSGEDVVWGHGNSTTPRYRDAELFKPGLQGTNYYRAARVFQHTQLYANSTPRPMITASRPRPQNQRAALIPPDDPFLGFDDDKTAGHGGFDR